MANNPVANVGGHAENSSVNQRRWPDEVVSFLNLVKQKFENEPQVYRHFLRMMSDYRKFRTSSKCLIVKVHLLFKGHEELLEGFNQFLPRAYRVCEDFDLEDAVVFVTKIKNRYKHDPQVFESFLEVLCKYRDGVYSIADTFKEVCKIFEGHPDLIIEYRKYLPPVISVQSQPTDMPVPSLGTSVAASSSSRIEDAINYLQKVKERFQDHLDTYRELLSILKDYKNQSIDANMTIAEVRDVLQGNHDLILGFNIFLPEERRMDKKMLVEYDRANDIINIIKSRFRQELNRVMPFLEVLDGYNMNAMTFEDFYREVMVSLENHPDLLDELRVPILMACLSVKSQQ